MQGIRLPKSSTTSWVRKRLRLPDSSVANGLVIEQPARQASGRRFALPLSLVRKVLPAMAVTPVANAPSVVDGVVEIRGQLHAVVSVARALGLGSGEIAADHHFVLARVGALFLALHVDRALSVVDLEEDGLVPFVEVLPGSSTPSGALARTGDGLLVVHDLPSFLSLSETRATGEALARHAEAGA